MPGDLGRLDFLIVEDNLHMLHIMRALLRGFGVQKIHESRDGADALSLIKHEPVDIIILDYKMPILDGIEFTQMLRNAADSRNRFAPIIMLTSYTERFRIAEMRDAGATEVCKKPVTPRDLHMKIASVINNPRPFTKTRMFFGLDRRRHKPREMGEEERRDGSERLIEPPTKETL